MIRLATVFPEALNLNGDQANVLVLKDFLQRCDQTVEVITVESQQALEKARPDFVFFGHGSQAAHQAIDIELLAIANAATSLSCQLMFVGSSVEFAIEKMGLGSQSINRVERESLFSVGELADFKVLGYRNTDSDLPNIWIENNLIFSMLHGPVLAKNPRLQQMLATSIGGFELAEDQRDWLQSLNALCRKIWELETDEVFPALG
jgi:CobQ-like glutamine amidotransferase family enzyme